MPKPNFFIVGAPKCGTTSMYHYLKQHPEIFMSEVKEPTFFATDFYAPYFIRDINEYMQLFSASKNERWVGEASALYLYSTVAAQKIKDFNANAKILILLRNPVDMIYSLHNERFSNGNEDIRDFEKALQAEHLRKKGLKIPKRGYVPEALYYREIAKYSIQVKRYFDVFGEDNIHIILFDDIMNNLPSVIRNTLQFLSSEPEYSPMIRVHNPSRQVRNVILRDFFRSPPRLLRIVSSFFFQKETKKRIISKIQQLNTKFPTRPPMDLNLRRSLQIEFQEDIEELSRLINRDLSDWCAE